MSNPLDGIHFYMPSGKAYSWRGINRLVLKPKLMHEYNKRFKDLKHEYSHIVRYNGKIQLSSTYRSKQGEYGGLLPVSVELKERNQLIPPDEK